MEESNSQQLISSGELQDSKTVTACVVAPINAKKDGQITQDATVPDMGQYDLKQSNLNQDRTPWATCDIQQTKQVLQDFVQRNKQLELELNVVLDNERFCSLEDRVRHLQEQLAPLQRAIQARESQTLAQTKMLTTTQTLPHRIDSHLAQMQARFEELCQQLKETEAGLRVVRDREEAFVRLIPNQFYALTSGSKDPTSQLNRVSEELQRRIEALKSNASTKIKAAQSLGQTRAIIDELDEIRQDYSTLTQREQTEYETQIQTLQKKRREEEAALLRLRGDYDLLLAELERRLAGEDGSSESLSFE